MQFFDAGACAKAVEKMNNYSYREAVISVSMNGSSSSVCFRFVYIRVA